MNARRSILVVSANGSGICIFAVQHESSPTDHDDRADGTGPMPYAKPRSGF